MKKLLSALLLVAVFAMAVSPMFAADPVASAPPPVVQKADSTADNVNIDVFATYKNQGRHYGEGVGVSYFLNSVIGVGAEAQFDGLDRGKFPDELNLAGNLILRSPKTILNLRPYLFGGGGRSWGRNEWEVHAGVGTEFKLAKHAALFGDWRVHADPDDFKVDDSLLDRQQFRAGLRFTF